MWRVLLLTILFTPILTHASNAGIVRGLWYSEEVFFTGEPVRIYVAVRNNTGADLSGTVEFFVNDEKIERKNIDALDGRIVESWADWNPKYGTSTITATLSRTELSTTASGTKAVEVISALAEDEIFVDQDTDKDDIGNLTDPDDDNDGISDSEEIENETDPLDPNSPAPESEELETNEDEEENETEEDADQNEDSSDPTGLEQFLVPSRADSVLTNLTGVMTETKKRIDDYRAKRDLEQKLKSGEIEIPVNDDGFGTIERITRSESNKPKAEKPEGFFGDIITFFGNVITAIWSGVLFVSSWFLGHPMLVQIVLLLLILLAIYKIAQKIGSRPQ